MRFQVKVYFTDGTEASFDAQGAVEVPPGAGIAMIHTGHGGHAILNIATVKYWEVTGRPIHIAAGLQ